MFHVHFLSEDILFLSIQILCSKFLGISEVELILEQVRKYDNKLVEFVDRMLKMIGDVLEVDLTSDKKVKESLIVHLRPTIFRLRYGTPQDNALIDFIKERIRKFVPEIGKLVFVSTHDYKTEDYWDYDLIISSKDMKTKDKRVAVIPNILNKNGIVGLRNHLDDMNSQMIENENPFSPELIFAELKVQTKEECLQVMCEAMKKKGVVKDDFYGTVMERERNTTTTIGNGISLPHGSPTAVNEPKVAVAFFRRTGHLG